MSWVLRCGLPSFFFFFQVLPKVELLLPHYCMSIYTTHSACQYLVKLFPIKISWLPWQKSCPCAIRMFGKVFVIIFEKAVGKWNILLISFLWIMSRQGNVMFLLCSTWKLTEQPHYFSFKTQHSLNHSWISLYTFLHKLLTIWTKCRLSKERYTGIFIDIRIC